MARTEFENQLVYGVDEKNRRIFFGVSLDSGHEEDHGSFSSNSVAYAVRSLIKMASDNKKPIEIHMNSYGGDPYSMLYLHDVIQSLPCQVKFFGGGAIMSAATWVMCACDERNLYPNTTIMVHHGWDGYEGKHDDVLIDAAESKRLRNLLCDLYSKNSFMPENFWQEVCQRDLYLSAQEAISLGLVDKIVEPKKRGTFRKSRANHLSKAPSKRSLKSLVNRLYERIGLRGVKELVIAPPAPDPVDPEMIIQQELTPTPEPTGGAPIRKLT